MIDCVRIILEDFGVIGRTVRYKDHLLQRLEADYGDGSSSCTQFAGIYVDGITLVKNEAQSWGLPLPTTTL
jgi:hypothetical protein